MAAATFVPALAWNTRVGLCAFKMSLCLLCAGWTFERLFGWWDAVEKNAGWWHTGCHGYRLTFKDPLGCDFAHWVQFGKMHILIFPLFFFFLFMEKKDFSLSCLHFSLCSEHIHRLSVVLCLLFGTAAIAGYPTCTHTLGDHKSLFYPASLHPNTHTRTLVIAALGLPSPPWVAPFPCIPSPLCLPPLLQPSVTTAVCQLSACSSRAGDEAETHTWGLQGRRPGLFVSPSCHSLLKLPLITGFSHW